MRGHNPTIMQADHHALVLPQRLMMQETSFHEGDDEWMILEATTAFMDGKKETKEPIEVKNIADAFEFTPRLSKTDGGWLLSVSVTGCDVGSKCKTNGTEVHLSVDVSSSMRSSTSQLKSGLKCLRNASKDLDVLSMHCFSNVCDVAMSSTQMTTSGKKHFSEIIDKVVAHGGTNLQIALSKGVEEISQRGDKTTTERRMLLLTDGCPTVGETDPEVLVRSYCGMLDAAAESHGNRVNLFVLGYGADYNAELCEKLVLATRERGGMNSACYHITRTPGNDDEIEVVMSQVMFSKPVACNISIRVNAAKESSVHSIVALGGASFGAHIASISSDLVAGLDIGNLSEGQTRTALFFVKSEDHQSQNLANIRLEWFDTDGDCHKVDVPLTTELCPDDGHHDPVQLEILESHMSMRKWNATNAMLSRNPSEDEVKEAKRQISGTAERTKSQEAREALTGITERLNEWLTLKEDEGRLEVSARMRSGLSTFAISRAPSGEPEGLEKALVRQATQCEPETKRVCQ